MKNHGSARLACIPAFSLFFLRSWRPFTSSSGRPSPLGGDFLLEDAAFDRHAWPGFHSPLSAAWPLRHLTRNGRARVLGKGANVPRPAETRCCFRQFCWPLPRDRVPGARLMPSRSLALRSRRLSRGDECLGSCIGGDTYVPAWRSECRSLVRPPACDGLHLSLHHGQTFQQHEHAGLWPSTPPLTGPAWRAPPLKKGGAPPLRCPAKTGAVSSPTDEVTNRICTGTAGNIHHAPPS